MSSAPATQQVVAAPAPDPNSFGWQNETLSAVGRGKAPASTAGAQRQLVARNAARVAAIKDLKAQVRSLPVGSDKTVGAIMDSYLNVRRAVEKELQQAQVVGEQPFERGELEMTVKLSLAGISDLLKQNYITPNEELPKPPDSGEDTGVAPVT